jgi:hypothetical protein
MRPNYRADTLSPSAARRIATQEHQGQRTRFGDFVVDHVARVAAAVPPAAQATAWLHDLFELTTVDPGRLKAYGLSAVEGEALELLTRGADEPYPAYIFRIATATGRAGRLARHVKLADLEDHLSHARRPPGSPPYAWARRRLLEPVKLEPSTHVSSRGHTRAA